MQDFISGSLKEIHKDWLLGNIIKPSKRRKAANILLLNYCKGYAKVNGYNKKDCTEILGWYRPDKSVREEGLLSIFTDCDKFVRNRKTTIKPGRFFKQLFPNTLDTDVESFVNYCKNEIFEVNPTYIYKIGRTKEEFVHAFTKIVNASGIYCNENTVGIKPISDSCMRYKFSNLGEHPVSAYASGSFEVHYLENLFGKVVARSVVFVKTFNGRDTFRPAPVYASTLKAGKILHENLCQKIGCSSEYTLLKLNWEGARFLSIKLSNADHYNILPYLDIGGAYVRVIDENRVTKYLIQDSRYGSGVGACGYAGISPYYVESDLETGRYD